MLLENNSAILFSDTHISDIFILEYMPCANGDYIKVYLYCLFLATHNKEIQPLDLAKKVGIDIEMVKKALAYWENVGAMIRKDNKLIVCDLKEKEVNKLYRPKMTSTPEEALANRQINIKRNEVITAINNSFFQGVMSPTWYTDMDSWFDKFKFEEDVMYALFKYCYDKAALHKNYILAVAQSWHSKGIINAIDLDKYYIEYEKFNEIKKAIAKKLKITRNLTEYEEAYIEKWVMDYGYTFNVIEMALKKTTAKTNPNFDYLNAIFRNWNEKGLKTLEDIEDYMIKTKEKQKLEKDNKTSANTSYDKRQYEDMDKYYYTPKSV